jgi:hypothetical protein
MAVSYFKKNTQNRVRFIKFAGKNMAPSNNIERIIKAFTQVIIIVVIITIIPFAGGDVVDKIKNKKLNKTRLQ